MYTRLKHDDYVTNKYLAKYYAVHPDEFYGVFSYVEDDDKTYDMEDVLKVPEDDANSVVYRVRSPLNFDFYAGALVTIDSEHHEIHKGHHYFSSVNVPLAGSATLNWVIEVDGIKPHMVFSVNSAEAGYTITTYEGVTADSNGTLQPSLNNCREELIPSTVVMRLNPTNIVTTGATVLRTGVFGTAGGTALRESGSVGRTSEVVFKRNTKYLLRITNLSTATNNINIEHSWYEDQ